MFSYGCSFLSKRRSTQKGSCESRIPFCILNAGNSVFSWAVFGFDFQISRLFQFSIKRMKLSIQLICFLNVFGKQKIGELCDIQKNMTNNGEMLLVGRIHQTWVHGPRYRSKDLTLEIKPIPDVTEWALYFLTSSRYTICKRRRRGSQPSWRVEYWSYHKALKEFGTHEWIRVQYSRSVYDQRQWALQSPHSNSMRLTNLLVKIDLLNRMATSSLHSFDEIQLLNSK